MEKIILKVCLIKRKLLLLNNFNWNYNVMQNITLEKCDKYKDINQYIFVETGIYEDANDNDESKYRMTISYELESQDDDQYPIADILDKYALYVTDFLESENDTNTNKFKREFGGELNDLKNAQAIIGKKVFNSDSYN